MSRFASPAASVGAEHAASLLALLGNVAALASRATHADMALPQVLQLLRDQFDASECTLWCPNSSGMPAVWRAGEPSGAAPAVLDLEGNGGGIATVTVRFRDRDLGLRNHLGGRGLPAGLTEEGFVALTVLFSDFEWERFDGLAEDAAIRAFEVVESHRA